MMWRKVSSIVFLVCLFLLVQPSAAGDDDIEKAGDILQIALPVGAGATTLIIQDWEGSVQFAKVFGASWLTTYGLKLGIGKLRPTGEARSSHPSGHTMGAFAGAAFIDNRYGHTFGIPAYALAAFTGWSRVHSDNHFFDDVVSGASISMLWSWFFVTPYKGEKKPSDVMVQKGRPHWSYNWDFGPAYLIRNEITAPSEGGTKFDLKNFELMDNPTTSSAALIDVTLNDKHNIWVMINPFEARDEGRFTQAVNFNGVTFPKDSLVYSAWRLEDLRLGYRYQLTESKDWDARVGLSAAALWTSIKLLSANRQLSAEVKDFVILPLIHAYAGYNLTEQFHLYVDLEGIAISNDRLVDSGIGLEWILDPHWNTWLGYRFYDKDISTSDLTNRVSYNALVLGFGHTF